MAADLKDSALAAMWELKKGAVAGPNLVMSPPLKNTFRTYQMADIGKFKGPGAVCYVEFDLRAAPFEVCKKIGTVGHEFLDSTFTFFINV